jgi:hypothetical protein
LDDLKNYYTTPSFISIFNFINHNVEATSNLYKFNLSKTSKLDSFKEKVQGKTPELSAAPNKMRGGKRKEYQGMEVREDGKEEG